MLRHRSLFHRTLLGSLVLLLPLVSSSTRAQDLQLAGPDVAWADACVDLVLTPTDIAAGSQLLLDAVTPDRSRSFTFHSGPGCAQPTGSLTVPATGRLHLSYESPVLGEHRLVAHLATSQRVFTAHDLRLAAEGYDPAELAARALVVYNVNADDADTLAAEYAEARGIPSHHLCGVQLPTGQTASADELLGARETAVQCLCATIPEDALGDDGPIECSVANLEQVNALSPITHLALIRGIPPRLTGTDWPSDFEEPSFDYYFSHDLAHVESAFTTDMGLVTVDYPLPSSVHGRLPPLDPSSHGAFAYGRIEAYDTERTRGLIDRTLVAEGVGIQGAVLTEHDLSNDVSKAVRNLTSSFDDDCLDYLTHEPFVFGDPDSTWPHETCRWGSTGSTSEGSITGKLPGSIDTTIPKAIGVGMLLGSYPWPNGQHGFNDFATMLRWRKSDVDCEPLCENLETPALVRRCQDESHDLFREINTECVGFAPGFIGHQIRSYPVQYYGFTAPGWAMASTGATEKTPPVIRVEQLAGGPGTIASNRYAHFGDHDVLAPDDSRCTTADGRLEPCPERITVRLDKAIFNLPPLPVDDQRAFRVSLRHRNQASPGGVLELSIKFTNDATGDSVRRNVLVPMDDQNLSWTEHSADVTVSEENVGGDITFVSVRVRSTYEHSLFGFVDLDDISVVDLATGQELLDPEFGGFDRERRRVNVGGDWAANVIDRLGGLACWGSSSHHLTGGWAFAPSSHIAGAFFSGRSLGESLASSDGKSGIVYGDPLYRPLAVKLWSPEGTQIGRPHVWQVWSDSDDRDRLLRLNVLHGTDHRETVDWTLSACEVEDNAQCGPGTGTVLLRGTGAVEGLELAVDELFPPIGDFVGVLRLTATNAGEDERALSNYAYLELYDHPRPFCADLNGNNAVDEVDIQLLEPFLPCTEDDLTADLDGDGDVDLEDNAILVELYLAGDPAADLDGDDDLDADDFHYLLDRRCASPDYPEHYDVDGDGAITNDDLQLLLDNLGPCPT
ncbi:MAG: hypothetical protein AAF533_00960 [Acidobacteriota bacterium]